MGLSLIRSHKYKTAFKNNTPPSPPQFVYRVKWPKVLLQELPYGQYITTSERFLLKYRVKANKQKTNFRKTSGRITHPTKSSKALQDIIVDETGLRRITEGLVQEVVDEVDAWLDSQHHALLQDAGGAQTPEPWQVNALHSLQKKHWF